MFRANYNVRRNDRKKSATKGTKGPELLVHSVPFVADSSSNGDGRLRTGGLRSASAALSQLSYIPSTKSPL